MSRKTTLEIELTDAERQELELWQRCTTIQAGLAKRGRVVLLRARGMPISHIGPQVGMCRRHVYKWIERFLLRRTDGLSDKPGRGRKPFFPGGDRDACSRHRLSTS